MIKQLIETVINRLTITFFLFKFTFSLLLYLMLCYVIVLVCNSKDRYLLYLYMKRNTDLRSGNFKEVCNIFRYFIPILPYLTY